MTDTTFDRTGTSIAARIQLAHLLLAGIVVLGGLSRLANLGEVPLSPVEAIRALGVWSVWQPGAILPISESPAYHNLTLLLMGFLGDSDVVIRLLPALSSTALILTPWLFRQHIGISGALCAALLLAVSPTQVLFARTAGGASLSLLAGMLLAAAWINYQDSRHPRWLLVTGAALGVGLAGSPIFYTLLVSLVAAWLMLKVVEPQVESEKVAIGRSEIRAVAAATALSFLVSATLFLWNLEGIGAAATTLGNWLGHFGFAQDPTSLVTPIFLLGRYEPAFLIFGSIAAVLVTWQNKRVPTFLVFWIVTALIVIVLQPGESANVVLITLPSALLVGSILPEFSKLGSGEDNNSQYVLGMTVLYVAGIAVLVAMLSRYSRMVLYGTDNRVQLLLIGAIALAGVIVSALIAQYRPVLVLKGMFGAGLLFLLAFQMGNGWWLGQYAANDTRLGLVSTASDDDIPILVDTIRQIGSLASRGETGLSMQVAVESPVLQWYLRDFEDVAFLQVVPGGTSTSIVITAADAEPNFGADYIGADFGLVRHDSPGILQGHQLLRHIFFRQNPNVIDETRVTLWARQDLAP